MSEGLIGLQFKLRVWGVFCQVTWQDPFHLDLIQILSSAVSCEHFYNV